MGEIREFLFKEYDIYPDRRTVTGAMETLADFGLDISKYKGTWAGTKIENQLLYGEGTRCKAMKKDMRDDILKTFKKEVTKNAKLPRSIDFFELEESDGKNKKVEMLLDQKAIGIGEV